MTKLVTRFFFTNISLKAIFNVSVSFSIKFGIVKMTTHARKYRSQLISGVTGKKVDRVKFDFDTYSPASMPCDDIHYIMENL